MKSFLAALLLTTFAAAPAHAFTIANQDKSELRLGIDEGNVEHVKTVPAGKSGDFTAQCKEGCGLTGPWGFSYMAEPGEALTFKDNKLDGATIIVTQ